RRWISEDHEQPGLAGQPEILHAHRRHRRLIRRDAATYPQSVALARLLASPYWRERILGKDWAWHDEFVAELRRTVAPGHVWDTARRTRRRRDHDAPLLEWRQPPRRLKFEPLPPGHAWNLPETIQPATADAIAVEHTAPPRDSDRRDDPVRQTVPST